MTAESASPILPEVEIFTDGSADPNPGPGGYGVVLIHPKKRSEASGGFRRTTNNRMEIYAAIKGLELLRKPCKVRLYADSQYLVNAMMEGWVEAWKKRDWWRTNKERAPNRDLWLRLYELCQIHQVEFVWVKGHAGNTENERCDKLSCAALRQPNLPPDAGYEKKPEHQEERPRLTQPGASLLEMRNARHQTAVKKAAGPELLLRVLPLLPKLSGHLRGSGGEALHRATSFVVLTRSGAEHAPNSENPVSSTDASLGPRPKPSN